MFWTIEISKVKGQFKFQLLQNINKINNSSTLISNVNNVNIGILYRKCELYENITALVQHSPPTPFVQHGITSYFCIYRLWTNVVFPTLDQQKKSHWATLFKLNKKHPTLIIAYITWNTKDNIRTETFIITSTLTSLVNRKTSKEKY